MHASVICILTLNVSGAIEPLLLCSSVRLWSTVIILIVFFVFFVCVLLAMVLTIILLSVTKLTMRHLLRALNAVEHESKHALLVLKALTTHLLLMSPLMLKVMTSHPLLVRMLHVHHLSHLVAQ
mmetsp:Transcript_569/g.1517  ORF Transcript_569/g.1517 Transcript_569/m.1517 type:complete len:124 (-) Transcript_569:1018-1389(-)